MVKIWKMNECDWVAAETLKDAKQCMADTVGNGVVDDKFEEEFLEDPEEISEESMDKYTLGDEDKQWEASQAADAQDELSWEEYMEKNYYSKLPSFRQALAKRIEAGDKPPFFFASTEY